MKQVLTDSQIKLVESHMKMAYKKAHSWNRSTGFGQKECISVALEGLTKAALKYDPSKGLAFSTFAYPTIDNIFNKKIRDSKASKRTGHCIHLGSKLKNSDALTIEDTVGYEDDGYMLIELREAIQSLNKRHKNIIIDHFFRGKNQVELAERYGISQTQISRTIKKAINKLRELLGDERPDALS